MKRVFVLIVVLTIIATIFAGCGKEEHALETEWILVEDLVIEDVPIRYYSSNEEVRVSDEYLAEVEYNSLTNE